MSGRVDPPPGDAALEIAALRERLDEAEATIRAISGGEVDAFLIRHERGEQVLLLGSAERPYRLLVDKMQQGAVTVDGRGTVLYANRRIAEILGRAPDQLTGAPFESFVAEASRAMLAALRERAPAGRGACELTLRDGDGRAIPVHVSATSLIGEPGSVCLLITDLRSGRHDEALIAAETLSRSILEQAIDAIVVCDRDGRVIRASRSAHQLCSNNPLLQLFTEAFPLRDAEGQPLTIAGTLRGEVMRTREFRLAGDGEVELLVSAGPVRDEHGGLLGCVVTMTEITARKATERALRDADRRKDEFLAILAHELRNPLAPIRNAIRILDMVGSPDPPAAEARQVIHRQVANLVRLVDDLLDVSRITQGKIKLQPEPVDLASIVSWATESSRPFYEERSHHLEVVLPEEPLVVHADVIRTTQAIANLMINAAKYTPDPGTVRLTVTRVGEGVGASAELRLRDYGIGIPAEVMPHIFDPFKQERFGGRREEGLGLGLTLARRLIELQGGTLEAFSDGAGHGSEFVIHLPLAIAVASTGSTRTEVPLETAHAPRRVLVVDDNQDAAESLGTLLRLLGHDTRAAFGGQEALEVAGDYRPDVVLLDIAMPGMNGYELARALRALPGMERTTLVALTGFGADEDRRQTQSAGIDRHLVKPIDIGALQALLVPDEAGQPG